MNKNRTFTRLFALLLAVVLALGCVGVTAFATTGQKEVTIYFYYHQDDYVEKTVMVDADATYVDIKTMKQAAIEAGIENGMGEWYIHGSFSNKIVAANNTDAPGVVWANVQCIYPTGSNRPVRPGFDANAPIYKNIQVDFIYEDTGALALTDYLVVTGKTVLVDIQDVAELALKNQLVLVRMSTADRNVEHDDTATAYVRDRQYTNLNINRTKTLDILYYLDTYDKEMPDIVKSVTVPYNADRVDEGLIYQMAPEGWVINDMNLTLQNSDLPDVYYVYARGAFTKPNAYELCLRVPPLKDEEGKLDEKGYEATMTVMEGGDFELPVMPDVYGVNAHWEFQGWKYNGDLMDPGIYNVDYVVAPVFGSVSTPQVFEAQYRKIDTWTITVRVGSHGDENAFTLSTDRRTDKNQIPEFSAYLIQQIFQEKGKHFDSSDYEYMPNGWDSVDSGRKVVEVRLIPKDEKSHALEVYFYAGDNGYITGRYNNPVNSYSVINLKTDSSASINLPQATANEGYTFVGWAQDGELVWSASKRRALISEIEHSYNGDIATATYFAVFEPEGSQTEEELPLVLNFNAFGQGHIFSEEMGETSGMNITGLTTQGTGAIILPNVVAAEGWKFVGWAQNGELIWTGSQGDMGDVVYTVANGQASAVYTAVFEKIQEEEAPEIINWTVVVKIGPNENDQDKYTEMVEAYAGETPELNDALIAAILENNDLVFDPDDYSSIGSWWISKTGNIAAVRLIPKTEADEPEDEPEIILNVMFDNGDGTWPADYQHDNACTFTLSSKTPAAANEIPTPLAPEGFTFQGWQCGEMALSGGEITYNSMTALGITSDVTWTAVYEEIPDETPDEDPEDEYQVVVTFTASGNGTLADGTNTKTLTLEPEADNVAFPEVTAAEGYVFAGWQDNSGNPWTKGFFAVSELTYADSGETRYVTFVALFQQDETKDDEEKDDTDVILLNVDLNGGTWITGAPTYTRVEDIMEFGDPFNYIVAPANSQFSSWQVDEMNTFYELNSAEELAALAENGVVTVKAQYLPLGDDLG